MLGNRRVAAKQLARWLSVCLMLVGLVSVAGVAQARSATTASTTPSTRTASLRYAPPSNAGEPLNERFRGVNWARDGDNFTTGDLLQDGISATDSYATVYLKATQILSSLKSSLNINTVRLGLNETTVADPWWTNYGAIVQAATNLRMNVILARPFLPPRSGGVDATLVPSDGSNVASSPEGIERPFRLDVAATTAKHGQHTFLTSLSSCVYRRDPHVTVRVAMATQDPPRRSNVEAITRNRPMADPDRHDSGEHSAARRARAGEHHTESHHQAIRR